MQNDRFTRIRWLFGDEGFGKLQRSKVLVCGAGGVGGFCVDALARSGVESITLIDKDTFDVTNQNRQIYSENVGGVKVDEFAKIYPSIVPIQTLITPEFVADFDFSKFDVVIDAIDDIAAKIALANAVEPSKFIASMGGAKRVDPTKIKVASVWKTSVDPLARKYRYELKKIRL